MIFALPLNKLVTFIQWYYRLKMVRRRAICITNLMTRIAQRQLFRKRGATTVLQAALSPGRPNNVTVTQRSAC